jgi:hypothetical protein
MEDRIEIHFDKRINGYVVTMPDFVTLDMIEEDERGQVFP